jgi:hypothetical protein
LYNQSYSSKSFTLAPATPTLLVGLNANRKTLILSVNGTAPAAFKFQSAPTSATDGFTLSGASVSGGQGGSVIFSSDSKTLECFCPVDAVYAYSALGTTVAVEEGVVANFL